MVWFLRFDGGLAGGPGVVFAGSLPDSSRAQVGIGQRVMDQEWVDDAGDRGEEFAAGEAEGCGWGVCLVIECGVCGGEEAVGSWVVVVAWCGVEAEGRAVGDAVDGCDDDGGVPAGAGR